MNRKIFLMAVGLLMPAAHANLVVNPATVNFLDQSVGSVAAQQTIFVQNFGPATQVTQSTTCYNGFQVSGFCDMMLNTNQSCELQVSFAPTQSGFQSCTIYLNATSGGMSIVDVSGTGVTP